MKREKRKAGLVYGSDVHHLDHIVPICHIMGIPLIVTDPEIAASVGKFYPPLEVIVWDYFEISEALVDGFEIIFSCLPRILFDDIFFFAQNFLGKRVQTVWVPHGCSDKGEKGPFFEALIKEEMALLYGAKMEEQLNKRKVFDSLSAYVFTGNYRHQFYLENHQFYNDLVKRELGSFTEDKKTILYAPTWQDSEGSSSFFEACTLVAEQLSKKYRLLIKPHPNLLLQDELKTREIIEQIQSEQPVLFLIDFPPIYPLLEQVDIYLGDMSSIGYDFLLFDRPLFFLSERNPEEVPLFRCGAVISPHHYRELDRIIEEHLATSHPELSIRRQSLYEYSFGKEEKLSTLSREIQEMIES